MEFSAVYIDIDGKQIPINSGITNIEVDEGESEFTEWIQYPFEGTMTVSDWNAPLSFRHLDKFKIIRMGGRII